MQMISSDTSLTLADQVKLLSFFPMYGVCEGLATEEQVALNSAKIE